MYGNFGEGGVYGEGCFYFEVGDVFVMLVQVIFFVVDKVKEVVFIEFVDVICVELYVVY